MRTNISKLLNVLNVYFVASHALETTLAVIYIM